MALVTIHDGWKYHGPLGQFLRDNKQSYANLHGYSYVDNTFPNDDDEELLMVPLQPWQKEGNRAVYYKKPRFILHLMEKYDNLDWLLWIDGDAIVTQPHISIEKRIEDFRILHETKEKKNGGHAPDVCLIWAEDTQPNAGVILVRNSPTSRELLRTALTTWEDTDAFRSFTDQASLTAAVQRNATYRECSLLLQSSERTSTLLQSRVRGPASWLWQPGHWIVHFPNHNYLELLASLKMVGRQLEASPPPLFPPLGRPATESLSKGRRNRFEAVRGAIRHAWRGYADVCLHSSTANTKRLGSHIPCDDVSPLAGKGHDWLFHAATLYDSLDTLALAFGTESEEYEEALGVILGQDLQASALRPTKTFEFSLRIVGGLLGAFSVTGDVRLLSRAKDAADAMLQSPFASSPTILPRMYDILYPTRGGNLLYKVYSRIYQWARDVFTNEHHYNSLAGVGSFSLEFHFLSQTLGLDKYRQLADGIFQHVASYQGKDGTVPNLWNVMTGEPATSKGGLGSGSDSFVEYLLKVPLLSCETDNDDLSTCGQDTPMIQEMLALYEKILRGPLYSTHIIRKGSDASIAYPTDNSRYHQLLCFLPGMIALGISTNKDVEQEEDFALAEALVQGCHNMYKQTATGLGPEEIHITRTGSNQKFDSKANQSYLLRPEYIESIFIMYRLTGKEQYQDMGWEVFESLEFYCKTDRGYTGLKDVYDPEGGGQVDDMPSYFIAETLKYLLLLFGPDDFLTLNDFVFTTEAHPMRRTRVEGLMAHSYIQAELSNKIFVIHVPFPWYLFGALVFVIVVLGGILVSCKRRCV